MDKITTQHAEEMIIMPLGGGQEVGRSCILLKYQNRSILLDCGCHPGRESSDSLPFFDSLDNPEDIDLILITHFHIDHCAALPYFTEKTNFKGRIFMTHATKAVMKLLLSDNIKLQVRSTPLYTEQDLQNCIDKIELCDYHETIEYKGIKFSATAAGHVLGAAMFMIDIDGIRILYTGDYSLEADRHLNGAEVPPGGPPDVMICESTFGITNLDSKDVREEYFTHAVESIVSKGGSCLIPVFALGRAQELLLILDEYWQNHINLQSIPIFYASKLATKSLRVYQTFINMMNHHVRDMMDQFNNPFKLKHIKNIQNSDFELLGPCVVMASPGFLQSGVSRQLFEAWCDEERHGVVIAGYTIEGTLAHDLLSMPVEIKCLDNRIKPRRCQIAHVSFSAHVDYNQNKSFIKSVMPDYIILVHGEKMQMKRLKEGLESEMRKNLWSTQHKPSIAMPENGVKVKLRFRKNINAEVVGDIATMLLDRIDNKSSLDHYNDNIQEGKISLPSNSLLVTENFNSKVVSTSELSNFTACKFGKISERLIIPVPNGLESMVGPIMKYDDAELKILDFLMCHLEEVFDELNLQEIDPIIDTTATTNAIAYSDKNKYKIAVQSLVTLSVGYTTSTSSTAGTTTSSSSNLTMSNKTFSVHATSSKLLQQQQLPSHVFVEWLGSPVSDTIADCVVGLILQAFSAFHALRRSIKQQVQPRTNSSTSGSSHVTNNHQQQPQEDTMKQATTSTSSEDIKSETIRNSSIHHKKRKIDITSQTINNNKEKIKNEEIENNIKGMIIKHEIDPSKSIISQISNKNKSESNIIDEYKNKVKLTNLLELLLKTDYYQQYFSSINMNIENDKLIFYSKENMNYIIKKNSNNEIISVQLKEMKISNIYEGFCYILFSDSNTISTANDTSTNSIISNEIKKSTSTIINDKQHHAVVSCDNDGFKEAILYVLSHIQ